MPGYLREIYLIRHGQSLGQLDISNYKKIGDKNLPLTPIGQEQAFRAGLTLKTKFQRAVKGAPGTDITAVTILHSTCRRASETAEHISHALDTISVKTIPDMRLDKQAFGSFDGCFTPQERLDQDPEGFQSYEEHRLKEGLFYARPPKGESMQDVYNRVESVLESLKRSDEQHIIVSHGLPILCAEAICLGKTAEWIIDRQDTIQNCAIMPISLPEL